MSRAQAVELIDRRVVLVGGVVAERVSRLVAPDEPLLVRVNETRYVSRGGEKLKAALDEFAIDVRDANALDAGASTGGFTDCLLQHGALSVVALDVGRGQLHERLRNDPRVTVLERTNLRHSTPDAIGGPFDVVTADLSFISLRTVAPQLVGMLKPEGQLVLLVKPQFEVGRQAASKSKGVIKDPDLWRRSLSEVIAAIEVAGATMMGVMVSPLRGADGNVEFLARFGAAAEPSPTRTASEGDRRELVERVVTDAGSDHEAGY